MLKILLFLMIVIPRILKVQSTSELEIIPQSQFLRRIKTDSRDPVLKLFHQSVDYMQYWFYQNFYSWLPGYNKLPWSINHHDAIGWHRGRPVYKPWSEEEMGMHHKRHEQQAQIENR